MHPQWKQFVEINKIGAKSSSASFETENRLSPDRKEYCQLWCKNPHASLILSGKTGLGKTYLVNCFMREVLKTVHISEVRYYKSKNLDDRMLAEIDLHHNCAFTISCACDAHFLFIDDFGVERYSPRVERDYYEIIDTRMEDEKPTVLSTNFNDESIKKFFGDRIHSRLQTYEWIQFEGEDLRIKE